MGHFLFKLVILKECDHFTGWAHSFQVYNARHNYYTRLSSDIYLFMLFNLNSNWYLMEVTTQI